MKINLTSSDNFSIQAWIMASRPRTLPAAAAPVFVAAAFAWRDHVFLLAPALACLFISILMQIGANFANDLFDHERGSDTSDRVGPIRVSATGLISPVQMRIGIVVVFGLAAFLGLSLIWLRGWLVLVLGVAIILSALAYTGGPFPYGYYGLGDIFVFLSFGLAAVCGTYYILANNMTQSVVWAAVSMGLLIINILVINNTRDIKTDLAANKHTLAVYLGRRGMLVEYVVCLFGAYLVPLGLWVFGAASAGGLFTWLSLPYAIHLYREFLQTDGPKLNKTLGGTAQLALIFAVLFSVGIAIFG